jgi:hypothetical protein
MKEQLFENSLIQIIGLSLELYNAYYVSLDTKHKKQWSDQQICVNANKIGGNLSTK